MKPYGLWNKLQDKYGLVNQLLVCANKCGDLKSYIHSNLGKDVDREKMVVMISAARTAIEELMWIYKIEDSVDAEVEDMYAKTMMALKNMEEGKV